MAEVGTLLVKIAGSTRGLKSALNDAEKSLLKSSRRFEAIGGAITRGFTLPFAAAGAAGVKLATDLGANFAKIENLVGVSGQALDDFKKGVSSLSTQVGKSQAELSQALFTITSAGLEGATAMGVLEQAGKASAIGMGETEQVALAAAGAINAYGKENLSAGKAIDILGATLKAGIISDTGSLAKSMGSITGIASTMGVSMAEVGANIAVMTKTGVGAEEAVTGLKAVMTAFLNPSEQARKQLEQLGLTAEDVRQRIRKDGLADTLIFLTEQVDGNFDALGQLIPNVRALGNVLSTAGAQAGTYSQVLADIEESAGFVNKGFEKTAKTADFQFKALLVQLQNVGITLGNQLLPYVLKFAGAISNLITGLSRWNQSTDGAIVKAGLLVAALGPALTVIGKLKGALVALSVVLRTKVAGALVTAFAPLAAGSLPIIATIGALAAGAVLVYKNWDKVAGVLAQVYNEFVDLYNNSASLRRVWEEIAAGIERGVLQLELYGKVAKRLLKFDLKGLKDDLKDHRDGIDELYAGVEDALEIGKKEHVTAGDVDKLFSAIPKQLSKYYNDFIGMFKGGAAGTVSSTPEVDTTLKALTLPIKPVLERQGLHSLTEQLTELPPIKFESLRSELDDIQARFEAVGGAGQASGEKIRAFRSELERMATAGAPVEDMRAVFNALAGEITNLAPLFAEIDNRAAVMGAGFDSGAAKINLLNTALEELAALGFGPASEAVKMLKDQLEGLTKEKKTRTFLNDLWDGLVAAGQNIQIPFIGETRENLRQLNAQLKENQAIVMNSEASEAAKDAARAQIAATKEQIKAEKEKGNIMVQVTNQVIEAIKKEVQAYLAAAIAGTIKNNIAKNSFLGGIGGAIAAGASIGLITGLFDKFVPKLATGGLAFGPQLAVVGDNFNSRVDPEVIAPLSKLKGMLGPSTVQVYGRISGQDILISSERAATNQNRTRGY